MFTKKVAIILSALALLCYVATAQNTNTPTNSQTTPSTKTAKKSADSTKTGDFYVSKKDHADFEKLQADLAKSVSAQGTEKKCRIEYRNCWIDYEWRCKPNPGGTVHCEQVPVRRCGKPERVCD